MSGHSGFEYSGPEALRAPIEAALRRVIDPEMALNIVEIGLVYGVEVGEGQVRVRLTMTSPACPVAEVLVEEVEAELARVVPGARIEAGIVWDPPWTPERMSERARDAMGW